MKLTAMIAELIFATVKQNIVNIFSLYLQMLVMQLKANVERGNIAKITKCFWQ